MNTVGSYSKLCFLFTAYCLVFSDSAVCSCISLQDNGFQGGNTVRGKPGEGGNPLGNYVPFAQVHYTLYTIHCTLHTAHCTMPFLQFRASRTGESISSGQVMDSSHSSHSSLYHRWWAPPMRPDRTTGGQLLTNTLLGQGRFQLKKKIVCHNNLVV